MIFLLHFLHTFTFQQYFESKWTQTIVGSLHLTHSYASNLRDPRLKDICLAFMVILNYQKAEIVFF